MTDFQVDGSLSDPGACGVWRPSGRYVWVPLALFGLIVAIALVWTLAWTSGRFVLPSGLPVLAVWWPVGILVGFAFVFGLFGILGWRARWYLRPYWSHGPTAREIVAERYALGEISREEFQRMSSDLEPRP